MTLSISLATKAVNKLGCKEKESNGRIKIKCPVCDVAVVRRGFRRHYETMHCAQDPVSCQFCQKSFKHRYSLDCHQRQSHPHEKRNKQSGVDKINKLDIVANMENKIIFS